MPDLVETGRDIGLQNPVVVPGSDAKWWISAIASWVRRFGRNPYEHGKKSASKIGSSTAFNAVWTTRSATVGIPNFLSFPDDPLLGIITCRTSTGRKPPDFNDSRMPSRNATTPTWASIRATVARSTPAVRAPALLDTRSHACIRNARS